MALAIHFEDLIRQGVVTDYADLARLGHVTRARVTQIMNLRLLAPDIQESLLVIQTSVRTSKTNAMTLTALQSLANASSWEVQRRQWNQLMMQQNYSAT
jgi:hypothetical protein